jgi:hypothetical protein
MQTVVSNFENFENYSVFCYDIRETLIKVFPAPNLHCEAAKPLQIRVHPPEVLRKH